MPATEAVAPETTRSPGDEFTIKTASDNNEHNQRLEAKWGFTCLIEGLVIITGCAHPGIVKIIRKVRSIVPEERVYLIMGGIHLAEESASRIESIIEQFRQLAVEKMAPCHCSGGDSDRNTAKVI